MLYVKNCMEDSDWGDKEFPNDLAHNTYDTEHEWNSFEIAFKWKEII